MVPGQHILHARQQFCSIPFYRNGVSVVDDEFVWSALMGFHGNQVQGPLCIMENIHAMDNTVFLKKKTPMSVMGRVGSDAAPVVFF